MTDGEADHAKLEEGFKNGHGRFTQFSVVGLADPKHLAKVANEIPRFFVEETRLGIPVALQSENLCGYPAAGGTLFPAQINMGCTWEPEMAKEMSGIIGEESHAVGISSAMSPVIDVAQDPRWGRTYETYGEDPYVISQFGINYVTGMQDKNVSCIAKHFLGYANSQGGLNCAAFRAGSRELYEIYATPFEAADKEAGLGAVMCNYGEIDGLPVIDNPQIIGKLLRDTMGFEGVCTSDGAAVMKTFNDFKIGSTYEEAGYIAKKAGTDTEIPVGNAFRHLPEYVRAGKLDEACIDDSVRRVLTVKFKCGLFENPYCDEDAVPESFTTPEKSALSEEIAAKSIVLLKNDGVLPLNKGTKIALVGPHADSLRYPVSGYTYPAYIEMMKAGSQGQSVSIGGMADEEEKAKKSKGATSVFTSMFAVIGESAKEKINDMNTVLRNMGARSLREVLSERFEVNYAEGCGITSEDKSGFDEAVRAAEESDVVVMACGGNSGWTNVTGGEGIDRQYLDLPGVQQELLEAVSAAGKPVIVILYGPQVFSVNWAEEHCAAIIEAFMPGQYAGKVLSDVLDGTVNPGGKLTMSVPRTTGQIPIYYNHRYGSGYDPERNVTGIFKGGYVTGRNDPLYHFGYGLSYTSFEFSDLG
ncbi:MAG: glycoside hydrolase family 3 C-terminal domain-containing protein, partial [Clostridiales bacterium]|nr:glycoside hydrolase family 3 C-terminal domain-containing protein [Clostridiales bacterium]